jgi:ferredoxin-NADP reductase/Na+-transporting NADH:ubiquinone oxidoreductase subunit NqrB
MFRFLNYVQDRTTMYRLLLYYLIYLLGAAFFLSEFHYLHSNPYALAISAAYLTAVCWISNKIFAYAFEAPTNKESSLITALILALIISPASTVAGVLFLTAAGGLAMASKYMLAIGRKHIFNPAAIAVVLTSLGAGQSASWWVGSKPMLPFVLLGGLLLARKIKRFQMIISFLATAYAATMIYGLLTHGHITATLNQITLNSALFFLAFVMLTEPSTSPATAAKQRWYGVLTGLLFPPQVHIAALYTTPELVLVAGNLFSYIVEPKTKLFPSLVRKTKLSPDIAEFVLDPGQDFTYRPGQYMEWTLPHSGSDSRGDRRYLTLASSPTEPEVRLGVKFYDNGSTYKKAMLRMDHESRLVAAQLGGDFVLPDDEERKLAFIAGGIGITPYRSMIKYLLDTKERRDVTVLYSAKTADDIVYKDILESARRQLGIRTLYCLTGGKHRMPSDGRYEHYRAGMITPDFIRHEIPDYAERLFYISGPQAMVDDLRHALRRLGVHGSHIKADFFPGYS